MSMNCSKSQANIPDGAKFCPECGTSRNEQAPDTSPPPIAEKKTSNKKGGCLGCLVIIIAALLIGSYFYGGNDQSKSTNAPAASLQAVSSKLTPEQKIEQICRDVAKENFVKIEITNNVTVPNGKTVFLTVKAKDNLTNNLAKKATLWQSRDIMKALYTANLPIGACKIVSISKLVDQYGKESEGVVMRCALDAATAQKINWKNADALEWEKILNEYWAHPAYNK